MPGEPSWPLTFFTHAIPLDVHGTYLGITLHLVGGTCPPHAAACWSILHQQPIYNSLVHIMCSEFTKWLATTPEPLIATVVKVMIRIVYLCSTTIHSMVLVADGYCTQDCTVTHHPMFICLICYALLLKTVHHCHEFLVTSYHGLFIIHVMTHSFYTKSVNKAQGLRWWWFPIHSHWKPSLFLTMTGDIN